MRDIKYYQKIIKRKKNNNSFSSFLKEVWSWYTIELSKRKLLSRYPDTERSPKIISTEEFDRNIDINTDYWSDYDFDLDFFSNFQKLFLKVTLSATIEFRNDSENTKYADIISSSKNVYLSFNVTRWNENIFYSLWVKENSKDVYNSIMVWDNSEIIYNCQGVVSSYKIFFSKYVYNCSNLWFCSNMIWSKECIFSNNLENKSYCINNIEYTKDEYFTKKEEILKNKKEFETYYENIWNFWKNLWNNKNTNSLFAINSENIDKGVFLYNVKNGKNVILSWYSYWEEEIYDTIFCWSKHSCYWTLCCWLQADNLYNCIFISWWSNLFYCYNMSLCSYCIWCVWLKNKSYCILNKQYTKEEWEELADKIFSQMEKDWILWDFFPWNINPYYFNDTIASLIWNFKKEEIKKDWYLWREEKLKADIPKDIEIIKSLNLGDKNIRCLQDFEWYDDDWKWQINPEILKKVIVDSNWDYYKIEKIEYDFLQKHWLALPKRHWHERIRFNFWTNE